MQAFLVGETPSYAAEAGAMRFFKHTAKLPEFVDRGGTWQPFGTVLTQDWDAIALVAWTSYLKVGRCVLTLDYPDKVGGWVGENNPVLHRPPDDWVKRDLRNYCRQYEPEREIVVLVRGARDSKAARKGETELFPGIVRTPKGLPTPPEAHRIHVAATVTDAGVAFLAKRREQQGAGPGYDFDESEW